VLEINMTMSPRASVPKGNMEAYERTSRTGLRCVENALVPVNKAPEDCKKILDFRCGYGRVLRALRARFPEAHITACDLNEDATKFCAETFGATPVQGYSDLSKTILPHKYDAIWVGSVFTHSIPDPFFNES
jgi:trans-aconitate methyltransferase